jgi:hypothetical protein
VTGPEIWDESRSRQADTKGRLRFDPGRLGEALARLDEAVVRPAAGIAYTPSEQAPVENEAAHALVERIARELDPHGVLSG